MTDEQFREIKKRLESIDTSAGCICLLLLVLLVVLVLMEDSIVKAIRALVPAP